MKRIRIILIIGLFLNLCCITKFDIGIEGSNPKDVVFLFFKDSVKPMLVNLNKLGVYRKINGEWDVANPIWEIYLNLGNFREVNRIDYGQVPVDFKELREARMLELDSIYVVVAAGNGWRAATEFVINKLENGYIFKRLK